MAIIIIGAGASGLAAAIKLKQNIKTEEITILEHLSSAGKKILATGNGRCNLCNTNADGAKEILDFFSSIGLVTKEDDGNRIYPYSLKAETVLTILLNECQKLGIEIITECNVSSIEKGFTIYTDKGIFMADNLVVATGGMAQKGLGSDGSGYKLLKSFGHSVTSLCPALVQLKSSSKYPKSIKGTRTKCNIKIELDGEIKANEFGEVLFTDYGLSGIAVMNVSKIVSENFAKDLPSKCVAILDLIPEMSKTEIKEYLEEFSDLTGILGTKIATIISKQAQNDYEKEAEFAKNWRLIITGTKGFDFAQITSGGIPNNELDEFESKLVPNLYIIGEITDNQFECGGFNLAFAWLSGIKAANKIFRKRNND